MKTDTTDSVLDRASERVAGWFDSMHVFYVSLCILTGFGLGWGLPWLDGQLRPPVTMFTPSFKFPDSYRTDTLLVMRGIMFKDRCKFAGMRAEAYVGRHWEDVSVDFSKDPHGGNRNRRYGLQQWGPWELRMAEVPGMRAFNLLATHHCYFTDDFVGPSWTVNTKINALPIPVEAFTRVVDVAPD